MIKETITESDIDFLWRQLKKERAIPSSWPKSVKETLLLPFSQNELEISPEEYERIRECRSFIRNEMLGIIKKRRWGRRVSSWSAVSGGRRIYYFAQRRRLSKLFDKLVARKIKSSFKLRVIDRRSALNQLLDAFSREGDGNFGATVPETIMRLDIKEFFESIERVSIQRILEKSSALPEYILEYLNDLWVAFDKEKANSLKEESIAGKGVPTGFATSNILAELVLSRVDVQMSSDRNVALYVRYVDDVVILCKTDAANAVKEAFLHELQEIGLALNGAKEEILDLGSLDSTVGYFEYLGYRFGVNGSGETIDIDISVAKRDRYISLLNRLLKDVQNDESLNAYKFAEGVFSLLVPANYYATPIGRKRKKTDRRKSGLAISASLILSNSREVNTGECRVQSGVKHHRGAEYLNSVSDQACTLLLEQRAVDVDSLDVDSKVYIDRFLSILGCPGHLLTLPAIDLSRAQWKVRKGGRL